MSSNPIPVRVPERQPEVPTSPTPKQVWPREKKASKFVIKISGVVPI